MWIFQVKNVFDSHSVFYTKGILHHEDVDNPCSLHFHREYTVDLRKKTVWVPPEMISKLYQMLQEQI